VNDPAADAARRRVEAVLERLARVEFQVLVVAPPDATRLAARDRAREAALRAGRGALIDEAAAAAREVTFKAFALGGFSGTWAATDMAVSVVRADDRVAAAAASEEAALAAVVEDLVDEDTLDVLRSTTDELESSKGIPTPGSLTAFAMPRSGVVRGPRQVVTAALVVVVGSVIVLGIGDVTVGLLILAIAIAVLAALASRQKGQSP
jgi:hypothetical protein